MKIMRIKQPDGTLVDIPIGKGADGKTPYIQDGYWYIDGVNTNVKAQGENGVGISKVEKTATNGKVDTYTITFTNGTTFVYTVTNGKDYVITDADYTQIAAVVLEMLGGEPIFGYVDEDNNIVLSGNLTEGTYTAKYDMGNNTFIEIGQLVFTYSITSTLTNCSSTNHATSVANGGSYKATISANSGYELKSVTVTMGGNPVTVTNGVIDIAKVTGDIEITATAEKIVPKYNNLFVPSEAHLNTRINSYNVIKTDANAVGKVTTNFMSVDGKTPFTANSKIYIKGATFTVDGNTKIITFKNTSTDYTTAYSSLNGTSVPVVNEGNGVISISGANSSIAANFADGVKQMVLVLNVSDSAITEADIQNIVITVDDPI